MISSIAELIADRIGTMPAGERRAAQTLIAKLSDDRPEDGRRILDRGRRLLPPTILRFVARLGFQNYPEFQS